MEFALPIPDDARRDLARGWLMLGLLSLLGSGVFSVLLVLARTPYVQNVFPWVDFFRTALVVHVDLSVLVWFLAFGGALWSLNSTPRFLGFGRLALLLAAAGALVIAVAPFFGAGQPLMSNYIPVLQHPLFFDALQASLQKIDLQSLSADLPLQFRDATFRPAAPPLAREGIPRALAHLTPPAL